ncbi:hypothetical protein GCM10027176_47060 [Actinoallomurus bryophytorum]
MISDTDPTKVVFPTPKPPPMMILTEVIVRRAPGLERAKSTENPFQWREIRRLDCEERLMRRGVDRASDRLPPVDATVDRPRPPISESSWSHSHLSSERGAVWGELKGEPESASVFVHLFA